MLEMLYWSFLEFGGARLCREEFWLLGLCVRTRRVDEVVGGLGAIVRNLLHEFRRFQFGGCAIPGFGRPVTAELNGILADGGAHQQLWGWVGASGRKPCFWCCNVVERQREGRLGIVAADDTQLLVELSCRDPARLLHHTSESIWAVVERLRAFPGGKTALGEAETQLGLHRVLNGILFDRGLRDFVKPGEHFLWEPMHVLTGNGVVNRELVLCAKAMRDKTGASWDQWHLFVTGGAWVFPRHCSPSASERAAWLGGKRGQVSEEKASFPGGSSEILSFFRILRFYMQDLGKLHAVIAPEVASFSALSDIVEYVFAPQSVHVAPDPVELARRVAAWENAHTTAYPEDVFIPKRHWLQHLARQLLKRGHLVNAHTVERKHAGIKQWANKVPVGEAFDTTVTRKALFEQVDKLNTNTFHPHHHIYSEHPLPQDDEVSTALRFFMPVWRVFCGSGGVVSGLRMDVGDVIAARGAAEEAMVVLQALLRIESSPAHAGCIS